ncbi:hypothetical protein FH972_025151 [Carpinus fangiana]|uniref:Beta-catenin-like protein 1 N-terminal domain-containing protein n=1 Tax=Carpinus fangiana TaxID=176857 RepID=A0A5N6L2R1_9ROSI|nr:hypothetical protein FH972_025151 [Carpinus fangiana]
MTSIDDLFRGRAAPTSNPSSNKRKLDSSSKDPSEIYKATKTNGKSPRAPTATVTDEEDDDIEAGPSLPPADGEDDGQEEEENPDDEEGRFFGSGVGADTRDALDYLNDDDDQAPSAPEKLDAAWVRRTIQTFSSRIAKNAEQRAKFEDQPAQFMQSEAALDEDVKALSLISEVPELYSLFAELGGVEKLAGLLAHENTDIAIGAVQVLAELIDEDVAAEQEQWDAFVDAGLEADLTGLLVGNLQRLNEDGEDAEGDRSGVYHTLSLIENLASSTTAAEAVFKEAGFLTWLVQRVTKKESPLPVGQNKQYAAEVLAILLQASSINRTCALSADRKDDIVDIFLQLLSPYRKHDPPKDSDEEEYLENIFDALTCLVADSRGKSAFLAAEGIELALIMLREATKFSKPRALRLLDHACAAPTPAAAPPAAQLCEALVAAAGLKPLFAVLAGRDARDDSTSAADRRAAAEHVLGVLASMLRLLPGESAPRLRLLLKFVEGEGRRAYQYLGRLVRLRREGAARLKPVEEAVRAERRAFEAAGDGAAEERAGLEDEWLGRRLDAGLAGFQTVDVVLAWVVAEDAGARREVVRLLGEEGLGLGDVQATLREQLDGLEGGGDGDGDAEGSGDMLSTLIACLD